MCGPDMIAIFCVVGTKVTCVRVNMYAEIGVGTWKEEDLGRDGSHVSSTNEVGLLKGAPLTPK